MVKKLTREQNHAKYMKRAKKEWEREEEREKQDKLVNELKELGFKVDERKK